MSTAYIDTDVLIRCLTGDDSAKQAAASALLQKVRDGELIIAAPDTVIADAVFVLGSQRLYRVDRGKIQELLAPLVRLRGFRVQNKRVVLRALELFAKTNLDFGDVMLIATMEEAGANVLYSYDRGFDRIDSVNRHEPS